MQTLTDQGRQIIGDLALRYGISQEATLGMLRAVMDGNGSMAQFNQPELGGSGQWMLGGMTMVGDMFNNGLKFKVDGLCTELSNLLANQQVSIFAPVQRPSYTQPHSGYGQVSLFAQGGGGNSGNWWYADLGSPSSSGSQNNIRYAYFSGSRRLAVELNGIVTIYDTLDHQIGGVSQQQGMDATLTFTSQYGLVNVSSLPIVTRNGVTPQQDQVPAQSPTFAPPPPSYEAANDSSAEGDIFAKIERLAELRQKNILSEDEFAAKKAELLSRL